MEISMCKSPKIGILGLSGQSIFMTVDHFHQKGETLHAKTLFTEPGGKGYNQAVAAARLGGEVFYLSAVGDDEYADICEERLVKEDVNFKLVRKTGVSTALATILTDQKGENQVTVFSGASELLNSDDVFSYEDELKFCDMFLLQLEVPKSAFIATVKLSEKYRIPIILNPAPAKKLEQELLQNFILITPNEQEAEIILGLNIEPKMTDITAAFNKRGICKAVVTLGGRGCLVVDGVEHVHLASIDVPVVDTTGAGDVFNAALAVRLAVGDNLIDAAKFATIASGLSVQHAHVLDGIPTEEEVITKSKRRC
jgi:ribokinase